jgi:hypothetical protein
MTPVGDHGIKATRKTTAMTIMMMIIIVKDNDIAVGNTRRID